jgi:GDP-4-dehydro-6-deoxy-D-mannose reductase
MRVYITGARGFVGRRLVAHLRARGHSVAGADRETDVCDAQALAAEIATATPEAVVHLAAQSSVAASLRDPDGTFRINYQGSQNLLESVEQTAPRARVLLVGSADQYGGQPPGAPALRETDPLSPGSPYARSKAAAEQLGHGWNERGGNVVMTRSFNHTGPGQADHFVAPSFARQVAEIAAGLRSPELRVGNLESIRDFLHVDDVIDAYASLLEPAAAPGVYNVASGEPHTIRELLDALIALARIAPRIEIDPDRVRPTDQLLGDASKLQRTTGWRAQRSFGQLIEDLAGDWRERVRA